MVSKQIDPDFELSAPMMFLKYFVSADVELRFKQEQDFERYLSKNPQIQSLLLLRQLENTVANEELLRDDFRLYFYGSDCLGLQLKASISELTYILNLF